MNTQHWGLRGLALALGITGSLALVGCGQADAIDDAAATTTQAILPDEDCDDGDDDGGDDDDDGCGEDGKVDLCHLTGSAKNPVVAIRISCHAVEAHLKKGDYFPHKGSCDAPPPPPPPPSAPRR
jgi:hypothetical protein